MTKFGDLLGETADELVRVCTNVGDVHLLNLNQSNGITPKNGEDSRNKFFIILGYDKDGNIIGGLVINSKINYRLPASITDYQLPISVEQFPFLEHNSFVNCSKIIVASKANFGISTYRGTISDEETLRLIIETVKESPTVNRRLLKDFGIIK